MKRIYRPIFLIVLLYSTHVCAQEIKISIPLKRYVTIASRVASRSAEDVPLLVKGDVAKIRSYVISNGGVFKYAVANKFASVILPLSAINDFAQNDFVYRVEGVYSPGKNMSDSVGCYQSHVFPVHNDSTPLSQAYLGDGVIVGIIDAGGFYFQHRDFKQSYDSTKTRFLYLWDQTVSGNPPANFAYGYEWDSAKINKGLCTETDPVGDNTHGTNALGVAAGNGLAFSPGEAYVSPAPKANIIGVKFLDNQYWLTNIVDGAHYIFSKADSLNEPCSISLSYGTYMGSHDGQDLPTQMLDSLITEHKGHTFVAACGDGGKYPFHLGYSAKADSQFTWFARNANSPEAFEFWIDTALASNFNFTVGVDTPWVWQFIGRDQYLNIKDFNLKQGINAYAGGVENSKGKVILLDTLVVEQIANTYHFVYYFGALKGYYYRFITKGSGRFDLWSDASYTGTWSLGSHLDQAGLPTVAQFPGFAQYVYPDSFQTICSGFQCSPNVISVANYTNRDNWIECSGTAYNSSGETPGNLSAGSSWGPTRDGRVEPDITAPGDESIAPGDSATIAQLLTAAPFKVAKGCKYNRNGGTSMAAPFVTGVAALYLQKFPDAMWKDVKAAIDSCATKDSYTSQKPISYEWGYGKINAFCIMLDTPSGIMPQPLSGNDVVLKNYPNPFYNYTNIVYDFGVRSFQSAEIDVYNMIGKRMAVLPLHSSSDSLQFNTNNLTQGMYIYRLIVDQKPLATGKFTILN